MSLDIYLKTNYCPYCDREDTVFSSNITHNLGKMAHPLGVYQALWRPEECGVSTAWHLIAPLKEAIRRLREHPQEYAVFEPENKWGTVPDFLKFMEELLAACEKHPNASVEVDR